MKGRKWLCCLLVLGLVLSSLGATMPVEKPAVLREEERIPLDFFADAVILGDSISHILETYCYDSGDLGEVMFLCPNSYSVHNAVSGQLQVWIQGRAHSVEDAIALTGARKVFIMLGVNDVAREGGVPGTMELWQIMLDRIREKSPDVTFYIESCFPVYRYAEYLPDGNGVIDGYNEQLRQFCEDNDCVYVDIAHFFKDEFNALADIYCSDQYVHITNEAAALWASLLRDPYRYSVNPLEPEE